MNFVSMWSGMSRKRALSLFGGVLLRMLADAIAINVAMWLAFGGAYVLHVGLWNAPADVFRDWCLNYIRSYWGTWTTLALLIFLLNGLYTRTRSYTNVYKAWVILRTSTLYILVFAFGDYLTHRGSLGSRAVVLLAWVSTVLCIGGTRVVKEVIVGQYSIRPKKRNVEAIKRVLVVGGAGYLGSALVPLLLNRGYKVRVLDSLLFGPKPLNPVQDNPNFDLIRGDIRNLEPVVTAMQECDAVVDLAAIVGDPACESSPNLAVEVNRAATRMLIEVARGSGVTRFIFASTCSVYGASDFLVDEHSDLAPLSTYARTKIDSESLLLETKGVNFHPTVLRLATLFGVSGRLRLDLVVNLLTARAVKTGKITIFNGEQWRPFLHVQDAARAILNVLEAPPAIVSGEIFNIGDARLNHTLRELSETIRAIIPAVDVQYVENEDRRNYRVSFTKIQNLLGFECERMLEFGIREIAAVVSESGIEDLSAAEYSNLATTKAFAATVGASDSTIRQISTLVELRKADAAGNKS